jgi:hypothetical protein
LKLKLLSPRPESQSTSAAGDQLQALQLQAEVGACVLDVLEEAPNSCRSFIRPCEVRERGVELHVIGAACEVGLDVALIDGRNRALDEILSRHGSEACHPVTKGTPGAGRRSSREARANALPALWPPSPRHRSTTLPWRLTMYPTAHSFRTSGGVIATAEA